ncbi:MAG TPA: hypothetical protein VGC42_32470 [Kofleriaceae bacterium]
MISYDDLVAALAGWRQRQGLPVSPAAAAAAAARLAVPRSAPPGPPPAAPQAAVPQGVTPQPIDAGDDEPEYDDQGDDYAIPLGAPAEPKRTW